jgi:HPt (histidine-containing phosphotransfer) domain-containing protein
MKEKGMIDWDRVASLRAEIGADDFAEVVEMFLDEADEVVARLRDGGSSQGIEADLHFLKGSALNLGFGDLASLCNVSEKRAARGEAVDLGLVVRCYAASRSAFEADVVLPIKAA